MQLGIGEAARKKMEQDYLGERGKEDCTIYWGEELINGAAVPKEVDGWVLLAKEVMRVEDWREQLPDPVEFFDAVPHLTAGDLCPRIANIEGIFLFVSSPTNPHAMPHTLAPSPLVLTPTASTALRAIALHIAQSIPLLLTSLPTSGKSLFLSHLSSILFPSSNPSQIITIHLSDTSLDARSLLGSLITSPTSPGKFEWIDGLVTRALREGKWLVLKDIDKASQEVLGVLLPLVESLRVTKGTGERAFVDAPNRSRVEAQNGFALFATRSVISTAGTIPAPTFLGHTHWNVVIIPAPTQSEQLSILSSRFPRLSGDAIRSLLDLWDSIREGGVKGRGLTFKDIEKWVIRVESLLPSSFRSSSSPSSEMQLDVPSLSAIFPNLSLREEIFLEAYTVFFASSPSPASQANSLMVVAEKLGLTLERTTSLIQKRVPEFEVVKSGADGSVSSVLIGRTRLTPRLKSSSSLSMPDVNPVTRPYALHRPSLTLLEQIALSVQFAEPLLLVGETGTGKTSSIQHLSSLLSYHLTVLNLSTQTESADLLGGFKPVDARTIASGVNEKFKRLFEGSFSLKKNEEFLEGVGKALVGAKWKRVVGMWREARGRALERIMARYCYIYSFLYEILFYLYYFLYSQAEENANTSSQRKRRKIDQSTSSVSESDWDAFAKDVSDFEAQYILGKTKFAFSFVEGPLIKALRSGHW
jgi:midasin